MTPIEMNKELLEEVTHLKNANISLTIKNIELKKQLSIHGVVKSLPDGDDVWCKASEMSRDNFADWYDNL